MNISYPTSENGIIVLLKTPTKYRELFPTLLVKTTDFQLVYNFEQTSTVTIFGEHGMMAHNHDGSANQSSRVAISNDSVFNSNRYPTISSVVYITTDSSYCVHLSNDISECGERPTAFNACECTAIHICVQRPFLPLYISLYIHV